MSKILISYRREDSADITGRIYDRLVQVFPQSVFRDVDSIPLGVAFAPIWMSRWPSVTCSSQ